MKNNHMNFITSYSKTRNLALENENLIISSIYYTLINLTISSIYYTLINRGLVPARGTARGR